MSPRLVRVMFSGRELDGFEVAQPAASVRVLLPAPGTTDLVMPTWNGNEHLLPDGTRPAIRTLTPLRAGERRLTIEIVVHGAGVAGPWALSAAPGDAAAVSGPARGYVVDEGGRHFFVAGDETALPAITQLLEALPRAASIEAHIELAGPGARIALPGHPGALVEWHDLPAGGAPGDTLVAAARAASIDAATHVWVAGEAAGVQRVRRHLFEELGVPRAMTWVRGYWKDGRAGDSGDESV